MHQYKWPKKAQMTLATNFYMCLEAHCLLHLCFLSMISFSVCVFFHVLSPLTLCCLYPSGVSCNARRSSWEMGEITEDFYLCDPGMPFIFRSQLDLSHTSAFYCCLAAGSWPMALLFSLHPTYNCSVPCSCGNKPQDLHFLFLLSYVKPQ